MRYTLKDLHDIYNQPLTTLIFRAQQAHHAHHDPAGIQMSSLKSIKTGQCSEDCKYCPQSAHYDTGLIPEKLLDTETILIDAQKAKEQGADRFCMGAAWSRMLNDKQLSSIKETVTAVKKLDLEVCLTLGMLTEAQASELKSAGCDYYNHNLDTSREYYPEIISTRSYDDRLETIENVRKSGMHVCSGGILGMGESIEDRLKLLLELSQLNPYPESVPVNALIPISGTPLGEQEQVDPFEFVRIIATARIAMPKTMVRLSAGRAAMSDELQALCFLAGANSIFLGDRLLTAANPEESQDRRLMQRLGLHPLKRNGCLDHSDESALEPIEILA